MNLEGHVPNKNHGVSKNHVYVIKNSLSGKIHVGTCV